ncbi:MAG: hypothetical protein JO102_06755, partial [Elusimicrobia bacterium]|nr:hypothetical protein [Elusimicrobiota bacterium]
MLRAFRSRILSVLVCCSLILSSCVPPRPVTRFKAFHERVSVSSAAVLSDIFIAKDVAGPIDSISVRRASEIAEMAHQTLSAELATSSYTVVASTFAGILVGVSASSFTIKMEDEGGRQSHTLPIFMNPVFADDP